MIGKLEHTSEKVSKEIRAVFQASYAVEAKLLKAVDFPPLKRTLAAFVHCTNDFYGYQINDGLVAVVELKYEEKRTHIQSLVVLPEYFRQGIASKLMRFILENHPTKTITVETGLENNPAKQLYQSFGFVKTREWDTDYGVRKIAFALKRS